MVARSSAPAMALGAALLLAVCGGASSACSVAIDAEKQIAWWMTTVPCANATVASCPAGPCSDAEFMSRSLAAGGALAGLAPSDPPAKYAAYQGFNLQQSAGLMNWMKKVGFVDLKLKPWQAPAGSIMIYQAYLAPAMVVSAGVCDAKTPVVHGGPHCAVNCSFLAPAPVLNKGIFACK